MYFDLTPHKHLDWRVKFKIAISKHETLDVDGLAKDDECEFGKWLYKEAKSEYSELPSYLECVKKHAQFHVEASNIAKSINARMYQVAQLQLGIGSGFSTASAAMNSAIDAFAKESAEQHDLVEN